MKQTEATCGHISENRKNRTPLSMAQMCVGILAAVENGGMWGRLGVRGGSWKGKEREEKEG